MAMKTTTVQSEFVCLLLFLLAALVISENVPSEEQACSFWQHVAEQMSTQTRTQMHCTSNSSISTKVPCTKLDCKGTYKYTSSILPSSLNVEVDYCFGLVLNHCSKPLSLDIYLQMPQKHVSYQNRVTHDQSLLIPGASFNAATLGKGDVYLSFHMVKNNSYVNFSMTVKVKITTVFGLILWPKGFERTLIPEERIPVPSCDAAHFSTVAPLTLGVCHPPHWRESSSEIPPTYHKPSKPSGGSYQNKTDWHTVLPIVPMPTASLTYNKSCSADKPSSCQTRGEACDVGVKRCVCINGFKFTSKLGACVSDNHYGEVCDVGEANECGPNQKCKASQSGGTGICDCVKGTVFNTIRENCVFDNFAASTIYSPIATSIPRNTTGKHAAVKQNNHSSTDTTAIIAGCVSAVVVLVIIVLVVYLVIRRKKSQYYDRHVLLSNDDDPLVI